MIEWLKALTALAQDQGSVHNNHLTTMCNFSSGEVIPHSSLQGHQGHLVHIYTCMQNNDVHKIKQTIS